MEKWLDITLIAASTGILVLVVLIIKRCVCSRRPKNSVIPDGPRRAESIQNGINMLHRRDAYEGENFDRDASKKANYYVIANRKPFFSWADHPSLITDAVENGWSRFAFKNIISSHSVKSTKSLLGACAASAGDQEIGADIEISWEVSEGSADFMQKIRLNPGLKKASAVGNSSIGAVSVIRAALPLPGPQVGCLSFPQEAYFEVCVVSYNQNIHGGVVDKDKEGEKIKLIREDFNKKVNEGYLRHVSNGDSQMKSGDEEMKMDGKSELVFLSVGLTGGASLPLKFPGSYRGSIGFNSSGSVHLDGNKLLLDSEKDDWTRAEKVIGCGYDPTKKKVIFTTDSQLVHEIHCKTEEFASPLYPTIAANADITVLVNLGQSPFKYMPANRHRTPNPCFIAPLLENSNSLSCEDSRELFSIGRVDSQWLLRSTTRSNNNTVSSIRALEYDQESDGDLFEIVLDSTGRSPTPP